MAKEKYYEKGFSYINLDPAEDVWDFSYSMHKNQNGTHFDLRLYCPSMSENVYSWNSDKHLLRQAYPTTIRRTKDHSIRWLTFSGDYFSKKGQKNTVKIIESGPASLIESVKNKYYVFSTNDRIFRLEHSDGKKFLYIPIAGLIK